MWRGDVPAERNPMTLVTVRGATKRTNAPRSLTFEEFQKFMEGVESVTQLNYTRLHWVAEFGGVRREWEAKIIDQTPDSHIAWEGESEDPSGSVTFESLGPDRTLITLSMDYEPQGTKEKVGDALGAAKRRVKGRSHGQNRNPPCNADLREKAGFWIVWKAIRMECLTGSGQQHY